VERPHSGPSGRPLYPLAVVRPIPQYHGLWRRLAKPLCWGDRFDEFPEPRIIWWSSEKRSSCHFCASIFAVNAGSTFRPKRRSQISNIRSRSFRVRSQSGLLAVCTTNRQSSFETSVTCAAIGLPSVITPAGSKGHRNPSSRPIIGAADRSGMSKPSSFASKAIRAAFSMLIGAVLKISVNRSASGLPSMMRGLICSVAFTRSSHVSCMGFFGMLFSPSSASSGLFEHSSSNGLPA